MARHALAQVVGVLAGAVLQPVHQTDRLLGAVLRPLVRLAEMVDHVFHGVFQVGPGLVHVHQVHRHDGGGKLALGRQLVVLDGIPLKPAFFLGVVAYSIEIPVDIGVHAAAEDVGPVVLIQGQAVDGLFDLVRAALGGGLALLLVQLRPGKHRQLLPKDLHCVGLALF